MRVYVYSGLLSSLEGKHKYKNTRWEGGWEKREEENHVSHAHIAPGGIILSIIVA